MSTFGRSKVRNSEVLSKDGRHFGPELDVRFLEKEAIPAIFSGKKAGDDVRVWAMDCGRGEVAYSLAMLLCEARLRHGANLHLTVFATDRDPDALTIARAGRYESSIEDDIAHDRLNHWFHPTERSYTVVKELRSTCVFSTHDLARDVPFSHLDLIYCGEALCRLAPEAQDKAVPVLHFALRNGYLLPFADDCLSRHGSLFAPADGANGVYRRLEAGRRFFPVFPITSRPDWPLNPEPDRPRDAQVHQLQNELFITKEHLRSTVEQLRTANRKLQFSNEEYQSLNEEIRSTNPELQASKVDLQSANKELEAVNGELSIRIDQLRKTNSDLRNFFDSSRIATIFLDRDLRITNFTPAITDIFSVIATDVGRSITDIACRLAYGSLPEDVAHAIHTLSTVEREISDPSNGVHYLLRVLPYRGIDDAVAGAVLTFLNISAVVNAEEAQRQSEARFSTMASNVPAVLFTADADMSWGYVNPRFHEFTGLAVEATLGWGWLTAVHPDDRDGLERRWKQARRSGGTFEHGLRLRDVTQGYRWYLLRAKVDAGGEDKPLRWTGSLLDTHDRHVAESRQRLLFAELQRRVKTILATVRSIAGHTKVGSASADEFFVHFDGRLDALARIQSSIARHADATTDLEGLLWEEILAHVAGGEDRVLLFGPALLVDERVGQALGLAVHELTTNALKYGALSRASGNVELSWRLTDGLHGQQLHLEWKERAVPIVNTSPKRVGFGREYLERRLPADFGAQACLEFQPGGVRFVIDIPLKSTLRNEGE